MDAASDSSADRADCTARVAPKLTSASTELTWDAAARIASVLYAPHTTLASADGDFLIDALSAWTDDDESPFAVLANAAGASSTDAEYRAKVSTFFRRRNERVFIALFNASALIRVVVEMLRVGSGLRIKAFQNEAQARAWLRDAGIAA